MDQRLMEIEWYVLNFKARHTEVLKTKLAELHTQETPNALQPFYQTFLHHCREYWHSKIPAAQNRNILDEDTLELIKVNFYLTEISYNLIRDSKDLSHYPLSFLEDVYDTLSLAELTEFFHNMQSQIPTLQLFPEADKYGLLKISNAMLKRLSTTHDTELRGQIHIFLTQIFSTLHKSGTRKLVNPRDRSFEDEKYTPQPHDIPYSHYKTFWTLQKYLNNPEHLTKVKVDLDEPVEEGEQLRVKNIQAIAKAIQKTLLYFRDNPSRPSSQQQPFVKRFPKFLTKYALFKNQLNDSSFRKVFLIQIYLFTSILDLESYSKEEKQLIISLKQDVHRHLDSLGEQLGDQVLHMIETERTWLHWVKEPFENPQDSAISRAAEKARQKKQEVFRRIYEDCKIQETRGFADTLRDRRVYKVETKPIEAGLNYYLNDVISQMDPERKMSEAEKSKNQKDVVWKSVRVISRFFLNELRIADWVEKMRLLGLEELVDALRKRGADFAQQERQMTIKPAIIQ